MSPAKYVYDFEQFGKITIGEYFIKVLEVFWDEKEGFSGKRPFGNSDWDCEIFEALAEGGFIEDECDYKAGHFVIMGMFKDMADMCRG